MLRNECRKSEWSFYAIIDRQSIKGASIERAAEDVISGGATVLQLRDKTSGAREFYEDALRIKDVADYHRIPLIINDRVDIAMAVRAAGVHLGQDDLPFGYARKLVGEERLLGASVHNLAEYATAALGRPDYLGVGTIYPSMTKRHLPSVGLVFLGELRAQTNLPLVAIGGINAENLAEVIAAGADGVAILSALFDGPDLRESAVRIARTLDSAKHTL